MPEITLIVVDFPAPDAPNRTKNSPSLIVKLTLSRAVTLPKVFVIDCSFTSAMKFSRSSCLILIKNVHPRVNMKEMHVPLVKGNIDSLTDLRAKITQHLGEESL